jgi:hypothetical protein
MSLNNRERILGDLVSIEAWFKRLTEQNPASDFFLHVRFQEAVFGSKPEDVVRFRVRLRKANITVVVEEPIKVPRDTVRRDRLGWVNTIEEVRSQENGAAFDAKAGVALGPTHASASLEANANLNAAASNKIVETRTLLTSGTQVEHSVKDGANRWTFTPAMGAHLSGHAFQETVALMKLHLSGPTPRIEPTVKVVLTCLREDIDIIDLQAKDIPKGILQRGMGEEKKLKLAEEILKMALSASELVVTDLSETFAEVTIADVLAAEE